MSGLQVLELYNVTDEQHGTDSAFHLVATRLEEMPDDSVSAFMITCNRLADTAIQHCKWEYAKHFLGKIISKDNIARNTDPQRWQLAVYNWAEIHYQKISAEIYNDTAALYFEKALMANPSCRALDSSSLRYANKCLGTYYNMLGDPKKALLYYSRQKQWGGPNASVKTLVSVAINSSIALREMNRIDEAIATATEGTLLPALMPEQTANVWAELSKAQLAKGMTTEAGLSARKALYILDTVKKLTGTKEEWHIRKGEALEQLALVQQQLEEYKTAITLLQEAVANYLPARKSSPISRYAGKACINTGNCFLASGQADSAGHYFHQALIHTVSGMATQRQPLPAASQLYAENTIVDALDGMAKVAMIRYEQQSNTTELAKVIECYELAFAAEKKLLPGFTYDESMLRFTRNSRLRSEKAIESCYRMYRLSNDSRWAEQAFVFSEKSKSVVLQEAIKRNIEAEGLQQDSNKVKIKLLQQQVIYFEKALAEAAEKDRPALQQRLAIADDDLLFANTTLLQHITYRNALHRADSLSVDMVRDALPGKHTALAEFFSSGDAVYVFLVNKNGLLSFIKTDSSFNHTTSSLLSFFTARDRILNEPAAYQETAYRLFQQSGLDTLDRNSINELIIIPDGLLSFVPFDALVTGISANPSPASFKYLVRQFRISGGYSASTLLKQAERKEEQNENLACFAPVFAGKERGFAPLPHTLEEVALLKEQQPDGQYYTGRDAMLSRFRQEASAAGIIHIASHASADTANGHPPSIEFADSSLQLTDIYALEVQPRLVVLSACETGIGRLDKSEGAMSLARGFYYAGAKQVITSLWQVDDKSTAALMNHFYRKGKNESYATALHEAKKQYLAEASVTYASPYFWAGFIHIGYQPPSSQKQFPWWTIALLIPAVMVVIYFRRRK
ncbi:MAG: CHAT domain-containing protein [Chitinophagaceae bacterium]|nr:CHAT domain-containing protein [Chitinophagaceae bacterium]